MTANEFESHKEIIITLRKCLPGVDTDEGQHVHYSNQPTLSVINITDNVGS